jgi:hypothetical protein
MGEKRTNTIVTSMSPIHTESKMAQRKGNIVKYHQDLFRLPSEESRQGTNGPPTFVHISEWLNQQDIVHLAGSGFPLRFELKFPTSPFREDVEHPEANIVAGVKIFVTGITETNDAFQTHVINLEEAAVGEKKNTRSTRQRAL